MNSKLSILVATVALSVFLLTAPGLSAQSINKAHTGLLLKGPTSTPHRAQQATAAPAQPGTFEARVEGFMRDGGFNFQKVKNNSWYLILAGGEMSEIRIILGAGPSSIAMGAVVVTKSRLNLNVDALAKLMKLSYDLNYVRVCIDNDGDLIVMAQRRDAWLNADEFKTTVSLVSAAADRAYAVMRPYLATQ